ncbi:MAG TPA: hypothetical protein VH877_28225 [Polyangia bacterium]|jgi:hypothetical protein|nr:hypothetical protein [Polyangia bacterium]
MSSKFMWQTGNTQYAGSEPTHSTEGSNNITSAGQVIVGVAVKISNDNFQTPLLQTATIGSNGTLGSVTTPSGFTSMEQSRSVNYSNNEVVVGVALSASGSSVTGLRLYARRLDPKTGLLDPCDLTYDSGTLSNPLYWYGDDYSQTILRGLAGRVDSHGNLTTLVVYSGNLIPFYQYSPGNNQFTLSYTNNIVFYNWTDSTSQQQHSTECPVIISKAGTVSTFTCSGGLSFQSTPVAWSPTPPSGMYTTALNSGSTILTVNQNSSNPSSGGYRMTLQLRNNGANLPPTDPIVLNPTTVSP